MATASPKFLVIVARFNELITNSLLEGARSAFADAGISEKQYEVAWVPGAFELPVVAARAARSKKYDAIVSLGCVIRGDTPHFDYVAGQAAAGIMNVGVTTGVPVIF